MASLVESGVANLYGGDRDSVGFFQMRVGIWNQGDYAGYPEKPELQAKWFIDQALAVKAKRIAEGNTSFETDPNQWGEWIADIERPAEEFRGRYQQRLDEARGLRRQPAARAARRRTRCRRASWTAPAPSHRAPVAAGGLVLPVDPSQMAASNAGGKLHGSEFGVVDAEGAPRSDGVKIHAGYDLFANGGAPVRSMITGKVVEARASRGDSGQVFGGTVKVEARGRQGLRVPPRRPERAGRPDRAGRPAGRDGDQLARRPAARAHGALEELRRRLQRRQHARPAGRPGAGVRRAATARRRRRRGSRGGRRSSPSPRSRRPASRPGVPTVGAAAVEISKRYLDTPYYWGGETPDTGFDCSGLMQYAYKQLGIDIPRVTYDQVKAGVEVPRDQLQPGDLILFAKGWRRPPRRHVHRRRQVHPRAPHRRRGQDLEPRRAVLQRAVLRRPAASARAPVPAGVLTPEETQDALAMQGGAVPAAAAPGAHARWSMPAGQPVAPGGAVRRRLAVRRVRRGGGRSRPAPKPSGSTVQFLPAVQAPATPDPNAVQPVAPVAQPDPSATPAAQPPAAPVDPAAQPLPPLPVDPTNPYPGDDAGKQALAQWLGTRGAEGRPAARAARHGGPGRERRREPQLRRPRLRRLLPDAHGHLEPGRLRGLSGAARAPGEVVHRPGAGGEGEAPRATATRRSSSDPNQWGEWIADIERPAEQYRCKYQTKLAEAQALLAPAAGAPAAS